MSIDDRYYGLYRGECTNNADPSGLYRIKAVVPAVYGENESDWALPCVLPGWPKVFSDHTGAGHVPLQPVPNVGASVWIMFEAGDPTAPAWLGVWRV